MIEITGLQKSFGRLKVLDDVSVSFSKGECIALIGPNGCGKTTLIKSILGMVIPDKGEIKFDNVSVKDRWHYRSRIGYMPQAGSYPDNMTIGQVIRMIKNIRKSEMDTDEWLIDKFKIGALSGKRMRTLSGGTTQKVSAAIAFLFNPGVLILDEPTAGLDPLSSELLKEKITAEKDKGKLILITSHLLNELDELVTRLIYMQDGKIKFHKSIDELYEMTGETKISKSIAHMLRTGTL